MIWTLQFCTVEENKHNTITLFVLSLYCKCIYYSLYKNVPNRIIVMLKKEKEASNMVISLCYGSPICACH